MSDSYIIEVEDDAAGILVRDGDGFSFHAAATRFFGLQGAVFAGPASAELAVRHLLRGQRKARNSRPPRPHQAEPVPPHTRA